MPARATPVRALRAIDIVETAYRLDGTEAEWLDGVLAHALPDLESGCGVYAYTTMNGVLDGPDMVFVQRDLDGGFGERLMDLNSQVLPPLCELGRTRLVSCGGLEEFLGRGSPVVTAFRSLLQATGIRDGFAMSAQDTEGGSVTLSSPSRDAVRPTPRVRGIWRRVGLHVAAALRLRRKLAAREGAHDALFDPSGKLQNASDTVKDDMTARGALVRAVTAMEQARGKDLRASPARALELWQGLVGGEWSLVEQWEGPSRRYLAAYRNRPELRDPRALTPTERAILKCLVLGAPNKEIVYMLGLPAGTVSSCVTQILRKLGVRRRVDLAVLADPSRIERLDLAVDGEEVGVLAVDLGQRSAAAAALSVSELEVVGYVVRGFSNQRIALERDVSVHTVANQLRAIYGKLNITSRGQLARAMTT
jgi:DNA-binding NarL/FixJ family response regulator